MRFCFFFSLVFLYSISVNAQTLQGYIYGPDNERVMYANVYMKYQSNGTSTDDQGYYFLQLNEPGVYSFIISSIGYKTKEIEVVVKNISNLLLHASFYIRSCYTGGDATHCIICSL